MKILSKNPDTVKKIGYHKDKAGRCFCILYPLILKAVIALLERLQGLDEGQKASAAATLIRQRQRSGCARHMKRLRGVGLQVGRSGGNSNSLYCVMCDYIAALWWLPAPE